MAIINGIDYGDLIPNKILELDNLAYSKYYSDNFTLQEIECDGLIFLDDPTDILSFNEWYGTEIHKRYINVVLRKKKLEKINNAD